MSKSSIDTSSTSSFTNKNPEPAAPKNTKGSAPNTNKDKNKKKFPEEELRKYFSEYCVEQFELVGSKLIPAQQIKLNNPLFLLPFFYPDTEESADKKKTPSLSKQDTFSQMAEVLAETSDPKTVFLVENKGVNHWNVVERKFENGKWKEENFEFKGDNCLIYVILKALSNNPLVERNFDPKNNEQAIEILIKLLSDKQIQNGSEEEKEKLEKLKLKLESFRKDPTDNNNFLGAKDAVAILEIVGGNFLLHKEKIPTKRNQEEERKNFPTLFSAGIVGDTNKRKNFKEGFKKYLEKKLIAQEDQDDFIDQLIAILTSQLKQKKGEEQQKTPKSKAQQEKDELMKTRQKCSSFEIRITKTTDKFNLEIKGEKTEKYERKNFDEIEGLLTTKIIGLNEEGIRNFNSAEQPNQQTQSALKEQTTEEELSFESRQANARIKTTVAGILNFANSQATSELQFHINSKPQTEGCAQASLYRLNPDSKGYGMTESCEVKSMIAVNQDDRQVYYFLLSGNKDLNDDMLKQSGLILVDPKENNLDLVPFTLNPSVVMQMIQTKFSNFVVNVVIDESLKDQSQTTQYLTNNLGTRNTSVTMPRRSYIGVIEKEAEKKGFNVISSPEFFAAKQPSPLAIATFQAPKNPPTNQSAANTSNQSPKTAAAVQHSNNNQPIVRTLVGSLQNNSGIGRGIE